MDKKPEFSESDSLTNTSAQSQIPQIQTANISGEYKLQRYRFVVAIAFILGRVGISIQGFALTSILQQISKIYQVSPLTANWASQFFFILNPIFTFPANQLIDTKGLAVGFRVGGIIIILGSILRLFVNYNFNFLLLSGFLFGISVPFLTNGISKISGNWFAPQSRQKVTTINMVSFLVFGALTNLIPGFMFSGYEADKDIQDNQIGKSLTLKLFQILCSITIIIEVIAIALIRDKPPTPPSRSSSMQRTSFLNSLKILIRNKDQIFLCLATCFLNGIYQAMGPSISQIMKPFGFDSKQVSISMIVVMLIGLPGTAIATQIVHKQKNQKIMLICSAFFKIVFQGINLWALFSQSFPFYCTTRGISGLFIMYGMPLTMELATELTFPVGEGAAIGFLESFNVIFSFCFGLVFSNIAKGENTIQSLWVFIIMWICIAIGLTFLCLLKVELRKMKADEVKTSIEMVDNKFKTREGTLFEEEKEEPAKKFNI